jgi:hypothetical protein
MPHQANSWAHVENSAIALGAAHNQARGGAAAVAVRSRVSWIADTPRCC